MKYLTIVAGLVLCCAPARAQCGSSGRLIFNPLTGLPDCTGSGGGGGSGTVTSVSVTTANGVSASVANPTTTPALTFTLGAIAPTTVNGNTITSSTGILTLGAGKTLTANNSITLAGTDATTMTFPSTSASVARTDAAQTFTGIQTFSTPIALASLASTVVNASSPGAGIAHFVGSTQTVTSSAVSLTADVSGVLPTANIAVALANQTSINGLGITASTGTLTITNAKTLAASNTLTLAGTDSTTMTFPTTTATIARTDAAQTFTGVQTFSTAIALVSGGTNATSASAAFNNLSPMTTAGDIIYGGASGTGTRLATGTAKQVLIAGTTPSYIDFPNFQYAPAAVCVNSVASTGWSTAATPAALCRAGTNNKDGLLSPFGASDVAYVKFRLPNDWDSAASLDISIDLTSTDATNGHTIIMQGSTICAKGDGTTTDDVAFNAAQSFGTITLNGNANRTWTATLTGATKTGCSAQSTLWIKLSRTTDTATNVGVYGMGVDAPRLLTVQAQ